MSLCFFFNDTATTEIYTLSLHDRSSDLTFESLQKREGSFYGPARSREHRGPGPVGGCLPLLVQLRELLADHAERRRGPDRKSTRLNSSHANISYAVFCLKKKKTSKRVMR